MMKTRTITLSTADEAVEFAKITEKCEFPISMVRRDDASRYNGKSLLSIFVLMGGNIEVFYSGESEELEKFLMEHRVTKQKTRRIDYIVKPDIGEAKPRDLKMNSYMRHRDILAG